MQNAEQGCIKWLGILWQNVDKHVPSPQPIPKNVFHYDEALVWKGKFENYLKSLQNKEYTSWVAVEHIICIYTLSSRYHYMEKLSINGTFLSINRVRWYVGKSCSSFRMNDVKVFSFIVFPGLFFLWVPPILAFFFPFIYFVLFCFLSWVILVYNVDSWEKYNGKVMLLENVGGRMLIFI